MSDLRGFDGPLQEDGYWLHESGYGHDYPMEAHGLDVGINMVLLGVPLITTALAARRVGHA